MNADRAHPLSNQAQLRSHQANGRTKHHFKVIGLLSGNSAVECQLRNRSGIMRAERTCRRPGLKAIRMREFEPPRMDSNQSTS
jgi:hypothetical protein